jgi:dihydroflavonol-4-reductase
LMHVQTALDHGKATRELGWKPTPVEDSIRSAVRWYLDERARSRPAQ